jgi:electron transport complex protein RnfC
MGGPMMGVALDSDDTQVSAATNCIIAATAQDLKSRGPEMPCIRCGDCAQACPAGLLPQQLLRYARLHDREALVELGLDDCIECGCCDYVCPSQIPLTSQFIAAKDSR